MYDLEFTDTAMTTWTMLRQTWTAVNKMAEVKLAKVGLTPEKAAVLWLCRDYSGTLTPAEIARYLFRENQTIAGLLNRMEAEGLVKRVPKRKGHPFTEVRLTPKGEEACGPGVEAYKKVVTSALEDMPNDEQERLRETLRALRDKMADGLHMEVERPPVYAKAKAIDVKW
jgi:DNA-binding MarR family transcriptional regulator